MKQLFTILATVALLTSCQKSNDIRPLDESSSPMLNIPSGYTYPSCVTPVETALMAGQSINVGTVTVWNDENNVYVHYLTTGDYKLKKTHLYVGSCSGIPVNNNGNPRIGHYPYQTTHGTTGVQSFVYTIPKSSLPPAGTCLCISSHAEIVAYNTSGQQTFSQTGWGQGEQIVDGGSWAMKFGYCPLYECGDTR